MSQQVVVVVTRLEELERACPTWHRPLPTPRRKTISNPFTGKSMEVNAHLPEDLEQQESDGEEFERLRQLKPFAAEFTIVRGLHEHFKGKPALLFLDEDFGELGLMEMSDADLDAVLARLEGFDNLELVNTPAKRAALGVKGYCWIYSF